MARTIEQRRMVLNELVNLTITSMAESTGVSDDLLCDVLRTKEGWAYKMFHELIGIGMEHLKKVRPELFQTGG